MKKLVLLLTGLTLLCFCTQNLKGQTRPGALQGTITDAHTGDSIPYAGVVIKDEAGNFIARGASDLRGQYNINPVPPGTYKVVVTFIGYSTVNISGLTISPNVVTIQDFKLREMTEILEEVMIVYERPLISPTKTRSSVSSESISEMAVRDVSPVASKPAGITRSTPISGRGSRSDGKISYIDGVKMRGTVDVSTADIQEVEVNSKGLPAKHNDHPDPFSQYDIDFISPTQIIFRQPEKQPEETEAHARILTAGEIHDFSKWELWEDISGEELNAYKDHWKIAPLKRYSVQLTFGRGIPVVDADARLITSGEKVAWSAKTDNTGKAELWLGLFDGKGKKESVRIEVHYNGKIYHVGSPLTFEKGINRVEVEQECNLPQGIDISFVVDATGSMADEIAYLKAELRDVIGRVEYSINNAHIRLSSVFYRDHGDAYVTQKVDFSADINHTVQFIKKQSAGGGGDYPEAVIEALQVSVNELEWRENSASRIIFLILDAPPHYDEDKLLQLQELLQDASQKGIRIIPIASSGIDKSTEYLLRTMALATNGTYTFLTNHSGVGNPHIEPTTDSYTVELLNDLMVRLIHQFTFIPPCAPHRTESADTIVNLRDSKTTPALAESSSHEQDEFNWRIYPNPTRGPVRIEFNDEVKELFLTDLRGKIISRTVLGRNKAVDLDLSLYPVGTYFIRFEWVDKWRTERIIVM